MPSNNQSLSLVQKGQANSRLLTKSTPATECRSSLLNDEELQSLFERLNLPESGRARIRQIRDSLPHRAVRSNKMSGKTRYAPIKMPFVIEVEATSTEYVAAVEWDHDEETLEFYPQVEPLKISYLKPGSSRQTTTLTTPDFLRITKNALVFVECKREDALLKLAKEAPTRYVNEGPGHWRSPPAEDAAAELGCLFEVRSSAQNNWTLHENLELLKDYFTGDPIEVSDDHRDQILDRIGTSGWVSMFDLVHMEPAVPADAIYGLLAQRALYFPIQEYRLADQEQALIFRDAVTFQSYRTFLASQRSMKGPSLVGVTVEPGCLLTWDGIDWQVINPGKTHVTIKRLGRAVDQNCIAELEHSVMANLVAEGRIVAHAISASREDSSVEDLLKKASTKDLRIAQWRYEVIHGTANDSNPLKDKVKRRIKFYWQAKYREAEVRYGNGFVGLLRQRGTARRVRASPRSLELARETIVNDWETIRSKQRSASWGRYLVRAKEIGVTPISYVTYCKEVKARKSHGQAVARIGEKAAYDLEPQYLELEWTTPRHGGRPWHIGHIDHTPLPLKCVHSRLRSTVDTIWLTILTDANTRKVLAYYLSFDPPSYRSCMMVLRDCVRRHNRVHQIIIVDQGSDFKSTYFETQLGLLKASKRERKAGKPRGGSTCERMFNTAISQFISNLLGSTDVVENYFRRVSPEVDPTRHAIWTLDHFETGLSRYLEEVYHVNHHSGLGMSPNEAWALGIKSHGLRANRLIPYDETFIAQSCPAVHRGSVKVTPAGVKINYLWFKCEALLRPGVLDTKIQARYDPFNAGLAYVYVHGQWHKCYSEHYAIFANYTERAVKLASERAKLVARLPGQKLRITAENLAMFLQRIESEEEFANQKRNDEESRAYRERVLTTSPIVIADAKLVKALPKPMAEIRQLEDL